jgi:nucleoid-associated protein EbfC
MLNPFKQLGEINEMRKKAMEIQKQLQSEEVIIDKNGVHIVISGDQKIKELSSNGQSDNDVKDAINEAIKKSQEAAAKKLSQMQGGLSGLLGGMGGQ